MTPDIAEAFEISVVIFEDESQAGIRCANCNEVLVVQSAFQVSELHIAPDGFRSMRNHHCPFLPPIAASSKMA